MKNFNEFMVESNTSKPIRKRSIKQLAKEILKVDYEVFSKRVEITLGHEIDPDATYEFITALSQLGYVVDVDSDDNSLEIIHFRKAGDKFRLSKSSLSQLRREYLDAGVVIGDRAFKRKITNDWNSYKITQAEFKEIMKPVV